MEIPELLLGLLSGGVLVIVSQLIGHYFARKNLKTQQEHSLRIVKMQLFHEDKKKTLVELDGLLKKGYKTFRDFRDTLEPFLNSSSGIFLPNKLRKELKKEIRDIDQFLYDKRVELYGYEPEYPEDPEDYKAWAKAYPEEALHNEIWNRLRGLKGSMREKIKKYVSEE